jgi:mono/diheme cytochrome c family protein
MKRTLVSMMAFTAAMLFGPGIRAEDPVQDPTPAPPAASAPAPTPAIATVATAGVAPTPPVSYVRYCSWCHGVLADGNGVSAHRFDVRATDFTRGAYKCRTTPSGSAPADEDLQRSIRSGLFGTGMPSFLALSPVETAELVVFLKSALPSSLVTGAAPPMQVPAETANDAASVQRGAASYARLKCDLCHGKDGRGGPNARKSLNDDGTPATAPFLTDPRLFKCGSSPPRLYLSIMTGLDGTPMAAYSEVASPEEAWDIVHFVQTLATGGRE